MDSLRNEGSAHPARASQRWLIWLGLVIAVLGLALAGCQAQTNGKEGTAPTTTTTNGGSSGGGGGGTTTTLSFATDVQPILSSAGCDNCHGTNVMTSASACSSCHSDGRVPQDYTVALTYSNIYKQSPSAGLSGTYIVDPGSSSTSVLYWVATQDSQYTYNGNASKMLAQMDLFTSTQVTTVKNWIDEGANP